MPAKVAIVALAFSATLVAGGAFDAAPWQYRAPVQVPEPGRLCVIAFNRTLYSRMRQDLADLRIVKAGQEVPYVIETMAGSVEERECRPDIVNRSAAPRSSVQITLDVADCGSSPRHSRIRLATERTNFRQRVRIETSDDNSFWTVAREDGYIFDFTQSDRKLSVLTVDYPVSTRRFVRATIYGWSDPGAVTAAWSLYRVERPAEEYIIDAITPSRTEDAKTQASLLTLDLGQSGLPHHRVRLESDGSSFHRAVELEASDDARSWRLVTRAAIFQVTGEQSLAVSYPERHDRYLRLRILNGDNRPVPATRVYVETLQRIVKFLPPSDGDFFMYYGNPGAVAPVYDLAAVLSRQPPAPEIPVVVGEWRINPAWRRAAGAQRPWSERHPALLYGALALAIAVMGFVTARFLIKVKKAASETTVHN
jgi:hypothetical protein